MKETIAKINTTKIWFSEKKKENDKPLVILIKKKRETIQIKKLDMKQKLQQTLQKYQES